MDLVDLATCADDFDAEVARTPKIDRFCSTTAWILPASSALMPPRAPFTLRGKAGYFAAMRGVHAAGFPYIEPVELAWGLAAPLIGADADALVEEVVAMLAGRRDWQLAILSGHTIDGPQRRALERVLPPRWEQRRGTPTIRHVASLDGGIDGFLARRSRDLRKSIRKSLRAAESAGVEFAHVRAGPDEAIALYERIQRVEARSWKATDGVGISQGAMRAFYAEMLPRLCARGEQRTLFARSGGEDIGYVLGAVLEGEYRGLQFSYNDAFSHLGVGGLLQYNQVVALCDEGVGRYDLGTEMDYKRRWAEEIVETEMLVLVR
ncbi:MAG: GNAT family N-acetyltransferase [Deltaproteobacteria bacterium]|nr:GNAT family N-acetyltransferase [Deltaproteobacteria bacterium]